MCAVVYHVYHRPPERSHLNKWKYRHHSWLNEMDVCFHCTPFVTSVCANYDSINITVGEHFSNLMRGTQSFPEIATIWSLWNWK
jgi:hypothetical protein